LLFSLIIIQVLGFVIGRAFLCLLFSLIIIQVLGFVIGRAFLCLLFSLIILQVLAFEVNYFLESGIVYAVVVLVEE
jgi:hypothetical protein